MNSNTAFFETLLKANRKFLMDYEDAADGAPEGAARVRAVAAGFLEGYAAFNNVDLVAANKSYMATIRNYMGDLKVFGATGKYPLEIDPRQRDLGRIDYDLFLILTVLLTRHRCAIMEEIMKRSFPGTPLVIGVGSGLELSFIPASEGGDAYDLYINSYARKAFPKWNFREEWYRPSSPRYGSVYAIELLEHLSEPYKFMNECHESLAPGGRLVATTASDVPQFDHRYNFVSDEEFEQRVTGMGFELESKRLIPHGYSLTNINARNVFYVFRKTA
jgi:hypothetical protein